MTQSRTRTMKQTISISSKTEVGDQVFISLGMEEHSVPLDETDNVKATLDEALTEWMQKRTSEINVAAFDEADEDDAESDEDAADEADEDEADADEVVYDDVAKMKKAELDELIKDNVEDEDEAAELLALKIKDKRAAVLELLFDEEENDESEDPDDDDESEESEESDDDEDDDGEDDEYTEEELKELKLKDLQEIAEEWGVEVKVKESASLKAKKAAYIKAILAEQEEE